MLAIWSAVFSAPSFGAAVTYVYDPRGRLVEVNWGNAAKISYNYDDAGNRSLVIVTRTP